MNGLALVCSLLITSILLGTINLVEPRGLDNDVDQRAQKSFEGPIFQEAEDGASNSDEQPTSWEPVLSAPDHDYASQGGRSFVWPPVIEPEAYFGMIEPELSWLRKSSAEYKAWLLKRSPDIELGRLEHQIEWHKSTRPLARMVDILQPYLPNVTDKLDYYVIRLGACWNPMDTQLALGADINDYAPDGFTDSELVRLFEKHARMRERLARDAQTGEISMSAEQQNVLNCELRDAYIAALRCLPLPSSYEPTDEDNDADKRCTICLESNNDESWVKLSCDHTFHRDCLATWFRSQAASRGSALKFCPLCRKQYRWPLLQDEQEDSRAN